MKHTPKANASPSTAPLLPAARCVPQQTRGAQVHILVTLLTSLHAFPAQTQATIEEGPWLDIHGQPRGAQVYIDDTPMGTLPFHQKLNPGTYQVRIQLPGYETLNTTTTLENDPAQTEHLQVSLPKTDATTTAGPQGQRRTQNTGRSIHPKRWLGIGMTAVGIGLLASSVRTGLQHGECRTGDCTTAGESGREVHFGFGAIAAGGIGLIATGIGIHYLFSERYQVKPFVSSDSAGLTVKGQF